MRKLILISLLVVLSTLFFACGNTESVTQTLESKILELENGVTNINLELESLNTRILQADVTFETLQNKTIETDEILKNMSSKIVAIEEVIASKDIESNGNFWSDEMMSFNENIEGLKENLDLLKKMLYGNVIFHPHTIDKGDIAAGMKHIDYPNDEGDGFLFSGEKWLKGKFNIALENEHHGNRIEFFVDESQSDVLPRAYNDYRNLWFVFSNYDEAYEMLLPYVEHDTITIVIDQYDIDLRQSDVVNSARFIKIFED